MYYAEETLLYLDGSFVKAESAHTDLYSQTLHYGYGVFEGIRSYKTSKGTKIFKAKEHYERLKFSAEAVRIPFNYSVNELIDQTYTLLEKNNFENAYIRPLVFCSPNMSLGLPNKVHIMIAAWEWGAYLGEKRLHLMISSYCRPHPRSLVVEAKVCGHYVNSILATTEAKELGFDEGLLLDCNGNLAEGPGSNLFFEKDGELFTPSLGHILPGITRSTIIDLCKDLKIPLTIGTFTPEDLFRADSAFLCGTAAEVIGIESVDAKVFPKKWELSLGAKLQKAYKEQVTSSETLLMKSLV